MQHKHGPGMARSEGASWQPAEAHPGQTSHPVQALPVDRLTPGQGQARRHFDRAALAELAASIAQSGVIQPVVVSGDAAGGYRLLAGERRWRAAQRAGLDTIPAIVRNDLAADAAALLGLIENLQRESLGVMETAHGLGYLVDAYGLTHAAIADRIGKSRAYVTNFLRLQRLTTPVQQLIDDDQLSLGHAKILAGIDGARQTELARLAASRGLTVRALERAARAMDQYPAPKSDPAGADANLCALEQRLGEHLGNPVRIRYDPRGGRGELRIVFHDLDEFDGLLAKLGYPAE